MFKPNLTLIKRLRDSTNHSLSKISSTLRSTNNDYPLALQILNTLSPSPTTLQKISTRQATQGVIFITGTTKKVMIELNCETDFVGRSELFLGLGKRIVSSLFVCFDDLKIQSEIIPLITTTAEKQTPATIVLSGSSLPSKILSKGKQGIWFADSKECLNIPVSPLNSSLNTSAPLLLSTLSTTSTSTYNHEPFQTIQSLINTHISLTGERIILTRIAATSTNLSLCSPLKIPGSYVHGTHLDGYGYGRIGAIVMIKGKDVTSVSNISSVSNVGGFDVGKMDAVGKVGDSIARQIVGCDPKSMSELIESEYLFGGSVKALLEGDVKVDVDSFVRFEVGKS